MRGGFVRFAAVLALCTVQACELGDDLGGPGNGNGEETTVQIVSTPALDGYVRSDNNLSATGALFVGDLDAAVANMGYRSFYSFDLGSIPPGSTITSATLRVYQAGVGGGPYIKLGNLVVDHVNYGDALDAADYGAAALASAGTLSTTATVEFKTLAVTGRVQADLTAMRTRSQFRLRFSTADGNNDGISDYAQLTDGGSAGVNLPRLDVTYY